MEITLKRKFGSSDRDPLIIVMEADESLPVAQRVKRTMKVEIGESLDVPEEMAYQIMGKYKGLFEIKPVDSEPKTYKTKIAKPEL